MKIHVFRAAWGKRWTSYWLVAYFFFSHSYSPILRGNKLRVLTRNYLTFSLSLFFTVNIFHAVHAPERTFKRFFSQPLEIFAVLLHYSNYYIHVFSLLSVK